MRTERRPWVTRTKELVKIGRAFPRYKRGQTDRHSDTQTDKQTDRRAHRSTSLVIPVKSNKRIHVNTSGCTKPNR